MAREGISGQTRSCMKAIFGSIRGKGKEKSSMPVTVATRDTGERIRGKVKACFFRTILQ